MAQATSRSTTSASLGEAAATEAAAVRAVERNGTADTRPITRRTTDCPSPGQPLAMGEGGRVAYDDLALTERIVKTNDQLPVAFLIEGATVQKAVCRVDVGGGSGTGWLIGPSLLITNNHVIEDAAGARTARAVFNLQNSIAGLPEVVDSWSLDPDLCFLTDAALDFTVVSVAARTRVIRKKGVDPDHWPTKTTRAGDKWGFFRLPTGAVNYAVGQFMNVIGHPSARPKEVALQENKVTTVFTDMIRYTTDTEPGSSGSPVLTNGWDPVALHHAGGTQDPTGAWLDNEGVRLDSIVAHLRAHAAPAILAELGL